MQAQIISEKMSLNRTEIPKKLGHNTISKTFTDFRENCVLSEVYQGPDLATRALFIGRETILTQIIRCYDRPR